MDKIYTDPIKFFTDIDEMFKSDYSPKKSFPPTNIKELDDKWIIEIGACGLDKSNFKIKLDEDNLNVSYDGDDENDSKKSDIKYIQKDFDFKSFNKSFTLPDKINYDGIDSEYNNGVLSIFIPKDKDKTRNKFIKVK